jgi:serine/threonine protein phosphatase PrpC
MAFDTAARTDVGCRRKVNEDSILTRPDLGLWAVADGMGGHSAGDVASKMVVEALGGIPAGLSVADRAAEARRWLLQTNARLRAMRADADSTIGSTVVALVCDGPRFACVWAGDSRAYRLRDGAFSQLTRDHSLVQTLVEAGELTAEEARDHPNANVITRAVGADDVLEVETVEGDVRPGDLFLLASDGLTRLMNDAELALGLRAPDLNVAAGRFLETCLARGAPDNVSLILVRA